MNRSRKRRISCEQDLLNMEETQSNVSSRSFDQKKYSFMEEVDYKME